MSSRWVDYRSDGKAMRGYHVPARGASRGSVLVVPEAPGLGPMPQRRANMLSDLGYDAFVVDLYGDALFTGYNEAARELMDGMSAAPGLLLERVGAGLDALRTLTGAPATRQFAIGYCFGGTGVLELARSGADVAGVVSFHGILTPLSAAAPARGMAKILVCIGRCDPLIPTEQVVAFGEEMERAGADYQLLLLGSGVGHGFTNLDIVGERKRPGFGYDEVADARAWRAMQDFFSDR
ncbi:dienelactone hydrolase family protein [Sphingomonas sp. YL-JM2C]